MLKLREKEDAKEKRRLLVVYKEIGTIKEATMKRKKSRKVKVSDVNEVHLPVLVLEKIFAYLDWKDLLVCQNNLGGSSTTGKG